jgi:rRNA processing protein Krr1/Pno1
MYAFKEKRMIMETFKTHDIARKIVEQIMNDIKDRHIFKKIDEDVEIMLIDEWIDLTIDVLDDV